MSTTNATALAPVAPSDPIAELIARLNAAADAGTAMVPGSSVLVTVRRVRGGFAIGRSRC